MLCQGGKDGQRERKGRICEQAVFLPWNGRDYKGTLGDTICTCMRTINIPDLFFCLSSEAREFAMSRPSVLADVLWFFLKNMC